MKHEERGDRKLKTILYLAQLIKHQYKLFIEILLSLVVI